MKRLVVRGILMATLLYVAAILQSITAYAWSIGPSQPEFILLTLILLTLYLNASRGAMIGLWAGVCTVAVTSPPTSLSFFAILLSRTLMGYLIGWSDQRMERDHVLVAVITVFLGTLLTELLYFMVAPRHAFLPFLFHTLCTATYNTVLAVPVYFLVKKLVAVPNEKRTQRS